MSIGNRDRGLLHVNHLPEFMAWAESRGYASAPPKGAFEALRLVRDGKVVSYYQRSGRSHITIHDDGANLVREWMRDKADTARRDRRAARRAAKLPEVTP